jgi:hypothetical protein
MAGDPDAPVIDGEMVRDDHDDRQPDAEPPPSTTNPALAILTALQSNGANPSTALIGALAGQSGSPNIDMLIKLLGNTDDDSIERQREALREEIRAEQAEAIAELGDAAKRLFNEREHARARIESLAAALGACPICFGGDVLCDTCHGAGTPGARAPDPIEFNRYVAPAIVRVREALRRAAVRRPWDSRRPTSPSSTAVTTAGATR